jgi:hypothetical protein
MVISLVQILIRRTIVAWPWYLLSFAQGFNIISRIMMLFAHATITQEGGALYANVPYLAIAFIAMLLSAFEIWYCELPEVHQRLASKAPIKAHA